MPTEHLPYSGFENIQPATSEPEAIATNSLAACAPKPFSFAFDSSGPQTSERRVQTASTSRTRCCSRAPSSSSGSPPPTTATRTRASATVSQSTHHLHAWCWLSTPTAMVAHCSACGFGVGQTTGPLRLSRARHPRPTSTALCLWTAWRGSTSGTSSVKAKGLPQGIFPRPATIM